MDLELILDSDTISETFSDLGKMKEFLSTLEYIDQPINTTLSSLLQVCCQYANDDTVVKYLSRPKEYRRRIRLGQPQYHKARSEPYHHG